MISIKQMSDDPSLLSLVISNIATISMALYFNWNVMTILWVYWFQSVIIGFFTVLKILTAKVEAAEKLKAHVSGNVLKFIGGASKLFLAAFFVVHYGMFHFVYAIFLAAFTFEGMQLSLGQNANEIFGVLIAAGIFFANHLFSFWHNFIKGGEREMGASGIPRLFSFPYARIVPMHMTIILGGLLFFLSQGNRLLLILFLLLKTGADVSMHLEEHKIRSE